MNTVSTSAVESNGASGEYCTPTLPRENTSAAEAADKCVTPLTAAERALAAAVEEENAAPSAAQPADDETAELLKLLQDCLIDPDEEIEPDEFLFTWNGVDIMPRQNVVSLKAPAKAGKTFVLSAFATSFLMGDFDGLRSFAKPDETILFVDTEQARNSTRKVLRRIMKRAPQARERIKVCNVRKVAAEKRIKLVELSMVQYRPALIIVDGIADLIPGMNYNDTSQADDVITKLSALAEIYNAVVITAIHTNKGNATEASGWLGRILLQKCSLEIGLTRKSGANTRTMEFVTRDREIEPISVEINDTPDKLGEIRIIPPREAEERKRTADKLAAIGRGRANLRDIGINPPLQLSRPEFVKLIADKKTAESGITYKRNSAEKTVTRYLETGVLVMVGDKVCFQNENDPL